MQMVSGVGLRLNQYKEQVTGTQISKWIWCSSIMVGKILLRKDLMNEETVIKLALTSGLLNYMDNETPRHYFIDGNAGLEEVIEFAELVIRECMEPEEE
jgi:hypothetical protein